MRNPLLSLRSRGLRQLAANFCLLAVSMQAWLPALHLAHDRGNVRGVTAWCDSVPLVQERAPQPASDSQHDPEACPLCRSGSQSRNLVSAAVVLPAPVVVTARAFADDGAAAPASVFTDQHCVRGPPVAS